MLRRIAPSISSLPPNPLSVCLSVSFFLWYPISVFSDISLQIGPKNTIVSGLRARHFKTSASMGFFVIKQCKKKKIPCFSASKQYVKYFQILQYCILRRARLICLTRYLYNLTDYAYNSCRIEYSFSWKWFLPSLDIYQIRQFKIGL